MPPSAAPTRSLPRAGARQLCSRRLTQNRLPLWRWIYELDGGHGWKTAAGIAGLALAALAVYAAAASELEEAVRRTVLPLGGRGEAKRATIASLEDQVIQVSTEPAVRSRL